MEIVNDHTPLKDPESEQAANTMLALAGKAGYERYLPAGAKPEVTRGPAKLSAENEDTVNRLLALAGQVPGKAATATTRDVLSPEELATWKKLSARITALEALGAL